MISLILYTHTDCTDVWPIYFGQMGKYLPNMKKHMFVDKHVPEIREDYEPEFYDDGETYTSRVAYCLNQIDDPWVIFTHEDMFLYDEPDLETIEIFRAHLEKTGKDFVRLIKCGETRAAGVGVSGLHEIPMDSRHIFAIQPTLWRLSALRKLFEKAPGDTIWEFELAAQDTCRAHNISGYYTYLGEPQRGRMHWDSKVFPYVATAVVKGRWNVREYHDELEVLFSEYGVDSSVRGYFR